MSGSLPLRHLRVLDFTGLLPGPYATQILADLGANIIRVESPTRPDLARMSPPHVRKNVSAIHAQLNRNKRSIALDLKKDGSKGIIYELMKNHGYDIIVEGFRPGVMARLGLGFDDLQKINPDLIYVSITGFGQHGDYAKRAGHDINYLALSGLSSYGENGPSLHATQIADIAGGSHHGVIGLLSAVIQRQMVSVTSGDNTSGQHVDVSMADAAFGLNCMSAANALYSGNNPSPGSEVLNGGNPCYGYYQTSDGRHLAVGALEPQFAIEFFDTIGEIEWVKRLAGVMVTGNGDADALKSDIASVIKQKTLAEWTEIFKDKDCCVEPVLTILEASHHPLYVQRGMVTKVPVGDGTYDSLQQIASPIKFSRSSPLEMKFAGGDVGVDTEAVLRDVVGYSKKQVQDLRDEGCIH
jgi:alpha-methylacyl-CoA racemase